MEIKQTNYATEDKIFWYDNYLIMNPKVYNNMKEYFRKEFEKEKKLKWYEKIINAIKKLITKI